MHSKKTIARFLDLRSKGHSLHEISARLRVPCSTLGDWNSRYFLEISRDRAANWEEVECATDNACERDLARLFAMAERCQAELNRRPLQLIKDRDLIRLFFATRREYFRRRDRLMRPLEQPASSPRRHRDPLCACSASSAVEPTRLTPASARSATFAVEPTRLRNDRPLISTPLQRGGSDASETPNRLNGFPHRSNAAVHSPDPRIDPLSAASASSAVEPNGTAADSKPEKTGKKPETTATPKPALTNGLHTQSPPPLNAGAAPNYQTLMFTSSSEKNIETFHKKRLSRARTKNPEQTHDVSPPQAI